MYQVVVQTSTSYSNTAKVVIAAVRKVTEKLASSASTYAAGAHSDLTGRESADQHPISAITNLQTSLNAKQDTLVSGTNIKTINSTSILGSGDIVVTATPTINTSVATGTVSTPTLLSSDINIITGFGLSSGYIQLPTPVAGKVVTIINKFTSNSGYLIVVPGAGVQIDSNAAGQNFTLSQNAYVEFTAISSTQWYCTDNSAKRTRETTIATGSPINPTANTCDIYTVTALAAPATIDVPSGGAFLQGHKLIIRIKDNGTSRNLTWTTTAGGYRVVGNTLPTATTANKTIYIGCIYNSTDNFWDVVAVAQEA